MSTIKEKIEALKTMLGDDKLVEEILSQSDEAQKAAAAAGKAFKEKAEAEAEDAKPVEPEAEVTEEKAAPKKPSKEKDESEEMDEADVEEEEDEFEDEEEFEDEDEEESKDFEPVFMGDLPIVGFVDMLAESVARALDPMLTEVRTLHKELTTVKEALDAKVAEKEADSKDLTELKAKTAATEKAVTDLTKKVSGLIADAPAAAKPYIASQADDNMLSEDKAKEMRDKSNLPHPPDGLSQFMNDFIGFKSNG